MKLNNDPKDHFANHAGRVNWECAKFESAECNGNQFKCFFFTLAEGGKRLLSFRFDTKMIENCSPAVHSVEQFLPSRHGQQKVNFKTDTEATHP
ncbi:hypothetical protein ANCCAN_24864 [Ancylostoma caninum]|uniref:Uncharacterized protein n=1 Tax=Ancylostoma caninum TaxID=29170 RepID=A0A368FER9_ANCCA|nr:hypothetical protein ANCCAN_24864 [Ancylostoma caninum]